MQRQVACWNKRTANAAVSVVPATLKSKLSVCGQLYGGRCIEVIGNPFSVRSLPPHEKLLPRGTHAILRSPSRTETHV